MTGSAQSGAAAIRDSRISLTLHPGYELQSQLAATASLSCSPAGAAAPACAIRRFSSGMQEPQLVPAFNCTPIWAADPAPAAMASQIVVRPIPKQAQTIGPALANPSIDFPDSNIRR